MTALFRTELAKLSGSLALLLALVAPALPGILAALSIATGEGAPVWEDVFKGFILPIWCLFLMPMVVAAFTTLVAQIEYRARGWDHLLGLPIPRLRIFAVKALIVWMASAIITLLVLLFTIIGAALGGAVGGHMPSGSVPWLMLGKSIVLILMASTFMIFAQLWVALRFSNFVIPLAIGIGGTLVAIAVAMTGTDQADWFAWVLPFKTLTATNSTSIALMGAGSGLLLALLMIVDLSRRSFD